LRGQFSFPVASADLGGASCGERSKAGVDRFSDGVAIAAHERFGLVEPARSSIHEWLLVRYDQQW